jgi:hypothetical protein
VEWNDLVELCDPNLNLFHSFLTFCFLISLPHLKNNKTQNCQEIENCLPTEDRIYFVHKRSQWLTSSFTESFWQSCSDFWGRCSSGRVEVRTGPAWLEGPTQDLPDDELLFRFAMKMDRFDNDRPFVYKVKCSMSIQSIWPNYKSFRNYQMREV